MVDEPPKVERRSSWRDEHLDCICGLANGRGGVLEIGRNERGEAVGVTEVLRLIEEIPVKVQAVFGFVVNVHLRSDCGRDYLRIVVPSHPTRVRYRRRYPDLDGGADERRHAGNVASAISQKTTRKPPEQDQKTARNGHPPESTFLSDRVLALLCRNPSASRREIAAALGTTRSKVRYRLDKLRKAGKIERIGPDKGGHWKVLGESAVEADATSERDSRSAR